MEISFGNLIDQLIVCNLKIWHLEDKKRDKNFSDEVVAEATRKTNTLNQLRNDLIEAIDKKAGEKSYGQGSTKQYGE